MKHFPVQLAHGMRSLRMPAMALGGALLLFSGAALATDPAAIWRQAEAEYDAQHYVQALGHYEALARAGDAKAAERAGQMLFFGHALFGKLLPQDWPRAAGWLKQAAGSGSDSARFLLLRLEAQTSAPAAEAQRGGEEAPYVIGPYGC